MNEYFSSISINENLFAEVTSEINRRTPSSIPQPILIVGEAGAGKTSLLSRIQSSVIDKKNIWIEGRSIFQTEDIRNKWEKAGFPGIIFIDDWDYYLSRTDYDDQYQLRRWIYNEGAPMMVATARKIVRALVEYNAPFFEGLDILYTEVMTDDSLHLFFNKENIDRALKLFNLLPKTIASIILINEIFIINNEPTKDIEFLLTRFSDKYKILYNGLPKNSQLILNCLDKPSALSDLRIKTNLSNGTLTPYLDNLKKQRIIQIDRSKKRKNVYSVKDPLFRLWLNK